MRQTSELPDHAASPALSGMTAEAVEAVLADLAAVADRLIEEWAVAQREVDERNDDNERWLIQTGTPAGYRSCPNPRRALSSVRLDHAVHRARLLRQSSREIVAWWADLATHAALSAAAGQPVNPVRAAGADPSAYLIEEELRHLPGWSDKDSALAELVALFTVPPMNPEATDISLDAGEFAAWAGPMAQRSPSGELIAADETSPGARLPRMWGDTWVAYQMPALPPADRLAAAFTTAGVPPTVVEAIREATRAVDDALAAAVRIAEPEVVAEEEALWDHVERSTEILAAYARTLTNHLPAIRTAAQHPRPILTTTQTG
ncbi:hypothetical protein ACFHW1_21605 [Micromonospora sp. LOL_014]|uniref:hypothetical protein n=1 Tax=Micromonospora sp. LOL_014 TaxID=3345415 RepID=UPI003A84EE27